MRTSTELTKTTAHKQAPIIDIYTVAFRSTSGYRQMMDLENAGQYNLGATI